MTAQALQILVQTYPPTSDKEAVSPDWSVVEAAFTEAGLDMNSVATSTYCRFGHQNIEALVDAAAITFITPNGILSTAGKKTLFGGKAKYNLIDFSQVRTYGACEHHDDRGLGKYCIEFRGAGDVMIGRLQWHYHGRRFRDNRPLVMAVAAERDRVLTFTDQFMGNAAPGTPSGDAPTGDAPANVTEVDLERFGRFEYNPQENAPAGDLEYRAWQWAQADQEAFLSGMATSARAGGWVAYGAERLIVSVIGGDLKHPAFDDVMRRALEFLRSNTVPLSRLSGYERAWWDRHDGASQQWLVGTTPPSAEGAAVSALPEGEERILARMTKDADSNLIIAVKRAETFVAVIDAPTNDMDPTRSKNDWKSATTLYALYLEVGSALQSPPHWSHPELMPFIPLPSSRLP